MEALDRQIVALKRSVEQRDSALSQNDERIMELENQLSQVSAPSQLPLPLARAQRQASGLPGQTRRRGCAALTQAPSRRLARRRTKR